MTILRGVTSGQARQYVSTVQWGGADEKERGRGIRSGGKGSAGRGSSLAFGMLPGSNNIICPARDGPLGALRGPLTGQPPKGKLGMLPRPSLFIRPPPQGQRGSGSPALEAPSGHVHQEGNPPALGRHLANVRRVPSWETGRQTRRTFAKHSANIAFQFSRKALGICQFSS